MSATRTAIENLRDIGPQFTVAEPATAFIVSLLVVLALFLTGDARGAHSVSRDKPVPILMYHVIAPPPAGVAFPDLFVQPSDFTAEMDWLAHQGFHAVTLHQVWDYWHAGGSLPHRPIVISFDDGYLSQATKALPELRKFDWHGVLNLKVNAVQKYNLPFWRVRTMIKAGWEIDAHTITHPDLTTVDDRRLWNEVDGSRVDLRHMFHVPVDFFCYPSGRYDAHVIDAVRRAGYLAATTTNYGLARPASPYTLSRVRINGSDGLRGFEHKLRALVP
jgi:peptidoglycan/xylan/chitin deacetylase (PgdA/CDA1 family)